MYFDLFTNYVLLVKSSAFWDITTCIPLEVKFQRTTILCIPEDRTLHKF
jgi:hypothetical protein